MTVRTWNHLSTKDFESLDRTSTLVLMPLGATEQHGPHLPVGTDLFLVESVLARTREKINDLEALVMPTLWCTKSDEHQNFPGALYLHAETIMAVFNDLAESVCRSGFKRLVIMNWHGGNTPLVSMLARDLRLRHNLLTFVIDVVYSFNDVVRVLSGPPPSFDIHAGRYETGMMMVAQPSLVKPGPYNNIGSDLERGRTAEGFAHFKLLLPEGGPVQPGWRIDDLTQDGVVGNPSDACVEEGERNLEAMSQRVTAILREIAAFDYPSSTG